MSDILQKINLTISSRQECSDSYTEISIENVRNGIQDELMLCAGNTIKGGGDIWPVSVINKQIHNPSIILSTKPVLSISECS